MAGGTMTRGFATAAGTAGYRARLGARAADGHFKSWQGLTLSSLGIGTYLGDDTDETDRAYEAAVRRALELGKDALGFGFVRNLEVLAFVLRELGLEGGRLAGRQ